MTEPSPSDTDHWHESRALLREVPVATATADLLQQAEERWRGKVIPRTSMADLFFTLPDEPFPWEASVRASQVGEEFEFKLSRDGVLISSRRTTEKEAPEVLDAFLAQLTTPDQG